MAEYPYHLVDVFTDEAFGGNPLAVFPMGEAVPQPLMQRIARELNLSETVFVQPPTAGGDFRLRIFTPQEELPMAGHPTVGTACLLQRNGVITAPGTVTFEEGVGPIDVSLTLDDYQRVVATMRQPLPSFGDVYEDRAQVAALLSLSPDDLLAKYPLQVVSTGVPFLYVPLRDLTALARARVRMDIWEAHYKGTDARQILAFTPQPGHEIPRVRSRMFAPSMGITEDPATGAASGPLGAYLVRYGMAPAGRIINEQGFEMGRPSLLQITIETDANGLFTGVYVGGRCVYMGNGTLVLDES